MKTTKIFSFFLLFLLLAVVFNYSSCTKDQGPIKVSTQCDTISYATDIKPIMQTYCATNSNCHVTGGFGDGDFTAYAGVAEKGDAAPGNGSIRRRVIDGEAPIMPPGGLPAEELRKIDCWLRQGNPDN